MFEIECEETFLTSKPMSVKELIKWMMDIGTDKAEISDGLIAIGNTGEFTLVTNNFTFNVRYV